MSENENKEKIISLRSETVPVNTLRPYPNNPRRGDVDMIAESLKQTGQYKPLVVQKSTNYVIAGNHTLQAFKKLRWKNVSVTFVDCDDDTAKRILLVDNRSNDVGSYDSELLARVLETLPNPVGTGYNDSDVRAILAGVQDRDAELVEKVIKPRSVSMPEGEAEWEFETALEKLKERHDARFGEEGVQSIPTYYRTDDELEDEALAIAEIQIELERYEGIKWPSSNYWGVPDLVPTMLVDTLPEPLDTWGGEEATPDDGVTTWLWNAGVAGTKGLPWERTIISFFTHDSNWYGWFDSPAAKVARALHDGCSMAVSPDTSFWLDDTRFHHLSAAYNSLWLSRFMQQAGLKVIPRLMYCDLESIKIGKLGIPKNAPVVSIGIQAINKKETTTQMTSEGLRAFIKELTPDALIVYGGNPAREVAAEAHLPKELHVVYLDNYAQKRRGLVYDQPTGKRPIDKLAKAKLEESRED